MWCIIKELPLLVYTNELMACSMQRIKTKKKSTKKDLGDHYDF
jgi:hypothetical protein